MRRPGSHGRAGPGGVSAVGPRRVAGPVGASPGAGERELGPGRRRWFGEGFRREGRQGEKAHGKRAGRRMKGAPAAFYCWRDRPYAVGDLKGTGWCWILRGSVRENRLRLWLEVPVRGCCLFVCLFVKKENKYSASRRRH